MPRVVENHERVIEAFQNVDIVSELVEKLPNGEFRNELDMDIILFGRSYRGKQVGPYVRLLEFDPGDVIVEQNTWESSIFYILVSGKCSVERHGKKLGSMDEGDCFGETSYVRGARRTATIKAETQVSVLRVSSTLLEQVSAACQLRFNRVFLRALVSRLQGNEPSAE